jgi:RNA polymerase sigma-70 factor, ECF subfamily
VERVDLLVTFEDAVPGETTMPLREIFRAHARFVWRVLIGLGVPERDAEDATQQAFLVLDKKRGELSVGTAVRTFLYGICLRIASEYRRRPHVRREQLVAEPPDAVAPATQEASAADHEALARLDRALALLDDKKREVFVLYEIEELPMPEIAALVGCPLQTAHSRLRAARETVLAELAKAPQRTSP